MLNPAGDRYLLLTQEELAQLAAVSRSRCNESLMKMKRLGLGLGLVEVEYAAVRIVDLAGLLATAAE